MNVFVEQLKALRTTMSSVRPEHFDMADWHCGTVACVCGHQAISGDLTHFKSADTNYRSMEVEIDIVANSVANDLESVSKRELGNKYLATSIWTSNAADRFLDAIASDMLTTKQLKHPHLTTDSSPEDVVSYIDMILGEVLNDVIRRTT